MLEINKKITKLKVSFTGFDAEAPETGRWMGDSYSHAKADGLRPWPPKVKAEGVDLLSLHPCSGKLSLFYPIAMNYLIFYPISMDYLIKLELHYRYGTLWKMFVCGLV